MGDPHRLGLACLAVLACLPAAPAAAQTAALRDDGGVVVNDRGLVAAFDADGTVDTDFGPDGAVRERGAGPLTTLADGSIRNARHRVLGCNGSGLNCDYTVDLERLTAAGGHVGDDLLDVYSTSFGDPVVGLARSEKGLLGMAGYPEMGEGWLERMSADGERLDGASLSAAGTRVRPDGPGALVAAGDEVLRFDAKLDPVAAFGEDGRVEVPFEAVDVVPHGDGVAVLGDGAVMRLRADGTPDPEFGVAGVAEVPDSGVVLRRVVVDAAGAILVGGETRDADAGNKPADFRVLRLDASGDLDEEYGAAGQATIDFGGADELGELLPLPGGGVIAAGTSIADGTVRIALARLTAAGDPADGYGDGGEVVAAFDRARPEVAIEGPAHDETVDGAAVRFAISTPETDVTLECRHGADEPFGPCDDPVILEDLDHGAHTFFVRATDPLGNRTSITRHFLVSPETVITSGPPAATAARRATFAFSSATEGTAENRFSCRVDDGDWSDPCPQPFTTGSLPDGEHTVEIRQFVYGPLGRSASELEPARWTWRVDTREPNTTVTSAPPATTQSGDATIPFVVDEAGTRSECRLDEGDWKACTSPATYSGLPVGPHSVAIRSIDEAGNVEQSAAVVGWKVVEAPRVCCAPPPDPKPELTPNPPIVPPPSLEQQRAAARAGLKASVKRPGRLRRAKAVTVDVGSAVRATVAVTGSLRMKGRRALTLRPFAGRVEAGRTLRAKLRLSKRTRALLRRRGGPRTVVVRLKVALARPDGVALTTRTLRVRLRR